MFQKKAIFLVLVLILNMLAGCMNSVDGNLQESGNESVSEVQVSSIPASNGTGNAKIIVRAGVLKGPSSLGMLQVMEKNTQKSASNIYDFTIAGAPDEIQAKLLNGELDIAAIPVNLAASLYNKTNKNIRVIAVGTLGVLYLLTKDEKINTFADLEGKTIYATGQGATPEYILNYLIDKNGLDGKVTVQYKSEHSELAALMASGNVEIAMLPQPFVTTVISKAPDVRITLDLNDEWRKASNNTELTMTCIVVRGKFLENSKQDVDAFLDEYKESAEFVNANVEEAAVLSEKYGIIPEAVAKQAIPKCGIVYIDGEKMKPSVNPFLEVLMKAAPQSIGGALPDDAFYYTR